MLLVLARRLGFALLIIIVASVDRSWAFEPPKPMSDSAKKAADSALLAHYIYGIDTLAAAADTGRFVIETRHRLYPKFLQFDTVNYFQRFPLGEDEEYVAEVIAFNPHIGIGDTGLPLKLSDTLYNPGVRIRVLKGDSVVQQSWAFHYIDEPHFRQTYFFAFKLHDFSTHRVFISKPESEQ